MEKSTLIGLQFISTARKAGKIVTSRRVWPQRKQLQSLAETRRLKKSQCEDSLLKLCERTVCLVCNIHEVAKCWQRQRRRRRQHELGKAQWGRAAQKTELATVRLPAATLSCHCGNTCRPDVAGRNGEKLPSTPPSYHLPLSLSLSLHFDLLCISRVFTQKRNRNKATQNVARSFAARWPLQLMQMWQLQ